MSQLMWDSNFVKKKIKTILTSPRKHSISKSKNEPVDLRRFPKIFSGKKWFTQERARGFISGLVSTFYVSIKFTITSIKKNRPNRISVYIKKKNCYFFILCCLILNTYRLILLRIKKIFLKPIFLYYIFIDYTCACNYI